VLIVMYYLRSCSFKNSFYIYGRTFLVMHSKNLDVRPTSLNRMERSSYSSSSITHGGHPIAATCRLFIPCIENAVPFACFRCINNRGSIHGSQNRPPFATTGITATNPLIRIFSTCYITPFTSCHRWHSCLVIFIALDSANP
jgi:hypothetical protein